MGGEVPQPDPSRLTPLGGHPIVVGVVPGHPVLVVPLRVVDWSDPLP